MPRLTEYQRIRLNLGAMRAPLLAVFALLVAVATLALSRAPLAGKTGCAVPRLTVTCGSPLLWPRALHLVAKWCLVQCRITWNCWRLGATRTEIRQRLRRK